MGCGDAECMPLVVIPCSLETFLSVTAEVIPTNIMGDCMMHTHWHTSCDMMCNGYLLLCWCSWWPSHVLVIHQLYQDKVCRKTTWNPTKNKLMMWLNGMVVWVVCVIAYIPHFGIQLTQWWLQRMCAVSMSENGTLSYDYSITLSQYHAITPHITHHYAITSESSQTLSSQH